MEQTRKICFLTLPFVSKVSQHRLATKQAASSKLQPEEMANSPNSEDLYKNGTGLILTKETLSCQNISHFNELNSAQRKRTQINMS